SKWSSFDRNGWQVSPEYAPVFFLLFTGSSYALGIGGYASVTYHNHYPGNVLLGGGFVLDTACALDKKFNYRLNAGIDTSYPKEHKGIITRIRLDNIFGFSVFRNTGARIWIGPSLGLHYFYTRISYLNNKSIFNNNTGSFFATDVNYRLYYRAFGAPLGVSLGFNFNIGDNVTLSCELAGRLNIFVGQKSLQYYRLYSITVSGNSIILPMEKYNRFFGKGGLDASCTVSFLYRINDRFVKPS
ncbi:MAG TPA: hypothetical protein PLA65_16215, partial [Spirochaetota bacterium]|nr:hypothetical protein [Spirochaetota bacterium]HPG50418.1 hypothetical protein [Spirochaetota bacterium]HPN13603.1 hypothetical protein [Spirochaetota bacterium]